MGVSTDAMLFYGYLLPEEVEISEELHDTYYSNELVQIGVHCSNEYPLYYVFVKESQIMASRGTPEEVKIRYQMNWDTLIKHFMDKHQLPSPGSEIENSGIASEIGWWLASYWG